MNKLYGRLTRCLKSSNFVKRLKHLLLKVQLHNDDLCVQLQCQKPRAGCQEVGRGCNVFIHRHFSRSLAFENNSLQMLLRINVTGGVFQW